MAGNVLARTVVSYSPPSSGPTVNAIHYVNTDREQASDLGSNTSYDTTVLHYNQSPDIISSQTL
jgi:hypothetical protein